MVDHAAVDDRPTGLISDVAVARISGFGRRFGPAHLNLARHAAFPLALTPDLLFQIWAAFTPDAPWIAVADLLLSSLCREVGYELYEMDNTIRTMLINNLRDDAQLGQARLEDLAHFLTDYAGHQLSGDDPVQTDWVEAQQWTALAYTQPDRVGRELALKLKSLVENGPQKNPEEILRLVSLADALADPLLTAGFKPLLVYAHSMKLFLYEENETATELLGTVTEESGNLHITGIQLPLPVQILPKRTPSQPDVADVAIPEAKQLLRQAFELLQKAVDISPEPVFIVNCMERMADIYILQGNFDQARQAVSEAEALVPGDYLLDRHYGFRDISEPVEDYWNLLGRLELHRAHMAIYETFNFLPHQPVPMGSTPASELSKEQQTQALLQAMEYYARAITYFLAYSPELGPKDTTFLEVYRILKDQDVETLQRVRERVVKIDEDYDTIKLAPLLHYIDETMGSSTEDDAVLPL